MNIKRSLEFCIRGWFPKEPTIYIIKSTGEKKGLYNWALCPFFVPGVLMIIAALLSVTFGLTLVTVFLPMLLEGATTVHYSGLFVGILSLGAFVLQLLSAALLLAKKHFTVAVTSMIAILPFSLAIILIPSIVDGIAWSGVITALQMAAFSVTSLILVGINYIRLKKTNAVGKTQVVRQPAENLAAGLGAVGFGLALIGAVSRFLPISIAGVDTIVFGISLLVVAFLVRRTYKHYGLQEQT